MIIMYSLNIPNKMCIHILSQQTASLFGLQRCNNSSKHWKAIDLQSTLQPIDLQSTLQPVDLQSTLHPIDLQSTLQPVDLQSTLQPVDQQSGSGNHLLTILNNINVIFNCVPAEFT